VAKRRVDSRRKRRDVPRRRGESLLHLGFYMARLSGGSKEMVGQSGEKGGLSTFPTHEVRGNGGIYQEDLERIPFHSVG